MKTNFFKKSKSLMMFLFMILAVGLLSLTTVACTSEDEGDSTNCEEQIVELAQIMNEKSNIFSQNPTKSNCTALKTAALNLINKAKKCGYEEQWAPATAAWEDIDCSDLDN